MKTKTTRSAQLAANDAVRLSGKINGVEYRLGVPNPFNGRNPAPLDESHLPALRALLSFVDADHLERKLTISKAEFTRRLPAEGAWTLLVDILICWVRTCSEGTTVDSHFGCASFEENIDGTGKTACVIFGQNMIPVIKGMVEASDTKKHIRRERPRK